MWFRLPSCVGGISVAGQEFAPEVTDANGVQYFRAPDHFAPQILDNEGFKAVAAPPDTDLPDLPSQDPGQAATIATLQAKIDALELEREGLRAQNIDLNKRLDEALKPPPMQELVVETVAEAETNGGKKK
jgi:hypothetical protein